MIRTVSGNLLDDDADALVNAVNTAGVMGKGIALQFKQTWPEMFEDYAATCRRGDLHPGSLHIWTTGSRHIINFPTKRHWRSRSKLPDIKSGLEALVTAIHDHHLTSVALPPLGCGHGGLAWSDVEPLIHNALTPVANHVDIRIYAPAN